MLGECLHGVEYTSVRTSERVHRHAASCVNKKLVLLSLGQLGCDVSQGCILDGNNVDVRTAVDAVDGVGEVLHIKSIGKRMRRLHSATIDLHQLMPCTA